VVRLDLLDIETKLGTAQIRKKIDDGVRMLERFPRQHADHMEGNGVRLETFDAFHHPGMRAIAVAGFPMAIVEPCGPVDADPDANRMCLNEVAPSIVDQHAIGLKMIGDVDFRWTARNGAHRSSYVAASKAPHTSGAGHGFGCPGGDARECNARDCTKDASRTPFGPGS
jgi:hypothetical protein